MFERGMIGSFFEADVLGRLPLNLSQDSQPGDALPHTLSSFIARLLLPVLDRSALQSICSQLD